MSEKKSNAEKLAFPCDGERAVEARSKGDAGLTKREYFVIMITQGYLAGNSGRSTIDAESAVALADRILDELENTKSE